MLYIGECMYRIPGLEGRIYRRGGGYLVIIQLSDHFSYGKLVRYTLPSIGMMIVISIYNVVDGFFVSNYVGKTPLAAINLIMPALMLLSMVGFIFSAGGTAIVAKTLGEGEKEKANAYFSLFIYFAFGVSVILSILYFIFLPAMAKFLGAEGELLKDCVTYGRIILVAMPLYILQILFQAFFSTAEKPRLGFVVTLIAGGTNMVLDAILILLLPQEYKLAGAALATVVGQTLGGLIPLVYFLRKNNSLLRLGWTCLDWRIIGRGCINGSSEFMSNVSTSIVGMLYNMQLLRHAGEDGLAAYGVMMYVCLIFAAVFIGYSMGSSPIVGFHYGAANRGELKNLLRKSLILVGSFSLCMVLAAELLAEPLGRIFVGYDPELLALTVSGFRIYGISFAFMGLAIFGSGFFTALNDGLTSAVISFIRTLVLQSAAILILPVIWGIDGVWISIVVAEFMAVLLTLFFLIGKRKRFGYW